MTCSRNLDLSVQDVIMCVTIQANHNGNLREECDDDNNVPKTHLFSLTYSPCKALYYTHYSLYISFHFWLLLWQYKLYFDQKSKLLALKKAASASVSDKFLCFA